MPFIKICGLQDYDEARMALDCGATALGFMVGVEQSAAGQVSAELARDIIQKLPKDAAKVIVTHFSSINGIIKLVSFTGTNFLQIGNDATPDDLRQIRGAVPHITLLKSLHITGPEAVDIAAAYSGAAHGLVLDSRYEDKMGGTGRTHDWSISSKIAAKTTAYLAGGLNPENVQQAIQQVRPSGVDVNSGVNGSNGRKDKLRMSNFIRAAIKSLDY
ncbi:MAG: phosphoribosylanthranilate isomerase [Alphaproteobacteria bacterium]|nr:phosphoribosylanthranilate isomerase [Alphaproteobacteria bacterium]